MSFYEKIRHVLFSLIKNDSLALCKNKLVVHTIQTKCNYHYGDTGKFCTVWFSVVDPDPHQSDKQDPDPYQSDNQDQDQDPDLWFTDPQYWSGYYLMSSSNYKIYFFKYEMMHINGLKKRLVQITWSWGGQASLVDHWKSTRQSSSSSSSAVSGSPTSTSWLHRNTILKENENKYSFPFPTLELQTSNCGGKLEKISPFIFFQYR